MLHWKYWQLANRLALKVSATCLLPHQVPDPLPFIMHLQRTVFYVSWLSLWQRCDRSLPFLYIKNYKKANQVQPPKLLGTPEDNEPAFFLTLFLPASLSWCAYPKPPAWENAASCMHCPHCQTGVFTSKAVSQTLTSCLTYPFTNKAVSQTHSQVKLSHKHIQK